MRNTVQYDVIVVGAGNAALTAALAAKSEGAKVLVLERAPEHLRGGNTYFTTGSFRVSYGTNPKALIPKVVPDISAAELDSFVIPDYTNDDYYNDVMRTSQGRSDPDLLEAIVRESVPHLLWMKEQGIKFEMETTLVVRREGKVFWPPIGMIFRSKGAGVGLSDMLFDAILQREIGLWYESKAVNLLVDKRGKVYGVGVRTKGEYWEVRAKAVILGCGGFEANAEMRAQYLGKDWDVAKVRGTIFNTGDMLKAALAIGAAPDGHYSACHNTLVDTEAPQPAIRENAESTRRIFTQFGILVNSEGKRIIDEGEDFLVYTYAKSGQYALSQPEGMAYEIFDAKGMKLVEDFYRRPEASRIEANSINDLEQEMGLPSNSLADTVNMYNDGVTPGEFDPRIKDGKMSTAIPVKSNWAQKLDEPPFVAYPVTAGITFTFGGLKINLRGQVLDIEGQVIPGLYACGEMAGGIFYYNYPGAGGLSKGAATGRTAGSYAGTGG